MADSGKPLNQEEVLRLLRHFSGKGPPANDRWATLWDAGDFLPWDQGVPNPALVHVMQDHQDLIGASVFIQDNEKQERRRKRALVPGCGRGYDVLLLSSLGYDAYGLEVSAKAVEEANTWAEEHLSDYPVQDQAIGPGKAQFIVGDFFSDEWTACMGPLVKFEFIYDYTVSGSLVWIICPPSRHGTTHIGHRAFCVKFAIGKLDDVLRGHNFVMTSQLVCD